MVNTAFILTNKLSLQSKVKSSSCQLSWNVVSHQVVRMLAGCGFTCRMSLRYTFLKAQKVQLRSCPEAKDILEIFEYMRKEPQGSILMNSFVEIVSEKMIRFFSIMTCAPMKESSMNSGRKSEKSQTIRGPLTSYAGK